GPPKEPAGEQPPAAKGAAGQEERRREEDLRNDDAVVPEERLRNGDAGEQEPEGERSGVVDGRTSGQEPGEHAAHEQQPARAVPRQSDQHVGDEDGGGRGDDEPRNAEAPDHAVARTGNAAVTSVRPSTVSERRLP